MAAEKPTRFDGAYNSAGSVCDPETGLGTPFVNCMYSIYMAEVSVESFRQTWSHSAGERIPRHMGQRC